MATVSSNLASTTQNVEEITTQPDQLPGFKPSLIDPTIIAALIAAAATATATATSSIQNVLNSNNSKDPIACVFTNCTMTEWVKVDGFGEPVHGEILQAPAATVLSLDTGKETVNDDDYTMNNNVKWAAKSKNAGSELLIVFYNQTWDIYAGLYAKNPFSGSPEAGVSLSSGGWFNSKRVSGDTQGKWLIDHIRNVSSGLCKLAKKGVSESVQYGSYKISFQGGSELTRFDLIDTSL